MRCLHVVMALAMALPRTMDAQRWSDARSAIAPVERTLALSVRPDDVLPEGEVQRIMAAGARFAGLLAFPGFVIGSRISDGDETIAFMNRGGALGALAAIAIGGVTGVHDAAERHGSWIAETAIALGIAVAGVSSAFAIDSEVPLMVAAPLEIMIPTMMEVRAYRRALSSP